MYKLESLSSLTPITFKPWFHLLKTTKNAIIFFHDFANGQNFFPLIFKIISQSAHVTMVTAICKWIFIFYCYSCFNLQAF